MIINRSIEVPEGIRDMDVADLLDAAGRFAHNRVLRHGLPDVDESVDLGISEAIATLFRSE